MSAIYFHLLVTVFSPVIPVIFGNTLTEFA
jgi:3'-phosphoadenosine 5'-phosphosulfate sulfotransferase (PAPS reductase)/FAD synthetase